MQHTPNFNFELPEASDYAGPANNNFTIIDDELSKRDVIAETAAKAAPVDADSMPLVDSADASKTKRVLWSAIKTALGTVFAALSHPHAAEDITSGEISVERGGTAGATAAEALANLISALSTVTPVSGDKLPFLSISGGTSGSVTLDNLFKAFETLGALKAVNTSYTGTGAYNVTGQSVLPLDFNPEIVLISGHPDTNIRLIIAVKNSDAGLSFVTGTPYMQGITITNWTPFTWYAGSQYYQLNESGKTYNVFAAGRDDV